MSTANLVPFMTPANPYVTSDDLGGGWWMLRCRAAEPRGDLPQCKAIFYGAGNVFGVGKGTVLLLLPPLLPWLR
jgi:hypothetical protein